MSEVPWRVTAHGVGVVKNSHMHNHLTLWDTVMSVQLDNTMLGDPQRVHLGNATTVTAGLLFGVLEQNSFTGSKHVKLKSSKACYFTFLLL